MNHKEYLMELYTDPRFEALVKEVLKHRPAVPPHDPSNDNTELWKAKSAEQRGFDVWCAFLHTKELSQ